MPTGLTNPSKIRIIVSVKNGVAWISTLLNILRKLSEEIYSQVAAFHINKLQRIFLALISHSIQRLKSCIAHFHTKSGELLQLLQKGYSPV